MPARECIEAEVLGRYVWEYHSAVLSADERVAIRSALTEIKNPSSLPGAFGSDPLPAATREPVIRTLYTAWRRVGERPLREHAEHSICINRCPLCSRIVATPLARQCIWCHYDWHDFT